MATSKKDRPLSNRPLKPAHKSNKADKKQAKARKYEQPEMSSTLKRKGKYGADRELISKRAIRKVDGEAE